ncbi:hypothetical protein IW262DRAFT_1468907 [Armillaria fumosa]|nr:hypothetical protein IW262DRAFT_1468907 [Armillaria fumosa]
MVLLAFFIDSSVEWEAGDDHPWAKGERARTTGFAAQRGEEKTGLGEEKDS